MTEEVVITTNVPNPGNFFSDIATALTGVRDSLAVLENKRTYITTNGGLAFLTAAYPDGLGMATPDAQALIAVLDQHHDVDTGYQGGAAAPVLNYLDNAAEFWGGR